MTIYALQRLLGLVPVLFGISVVIFLTMKLIPGDVARALLGPMATDQSLAQLRHALGLDEAIHVQYGKWLWRALHGDLGLSPIVHKPVMDLLLQSSATRSSSAARASPSRWWEASPSASSPRRGRRPRSTAPPWASRSWWATCRPSGWGSC